MSSGLRRRLLTLLLAPLFVLALVNAWFDYRQADSAAVQQDRQLERAHAGISASTISW